LLQVRKSVDVIFNSCHKKVYKEFEKILKFGVNGWLNRYSNFFNFKLCSDLLSAKIHRFLKWSKSLIFSCWFKILLLRLLQQSYCNIFCSCILSFNATWCYSLICVQKLLQIWLVADDRINVTKLALCMLTFVRVQNVSFICIYYQISL
jgi:hypothetical protein